MKKKDKFIQYNMAGIIAMIIAFIIQLILNQQIKVMRSLPDEMGAVYLAAELAGYEWTYVMTHPAQYYGFTTAPFMWVFFKIVKEPLMLYQCLLAIGAFLRSVPALIGCRVLTRFYGWKNQKLLVICGLICVFCAPTRASNIDNEPMLIFLSWLIFYIILELQHTTKKNKKVYMSILLSILLAYSIMTHTRAILYVVAIIIVIMAYYFFEKKQLVNFKVFGVSLFIAMILGYVMVNHITDILYFTESVDSVANTGKGLMDRILESGKIIVSSNGIFAYLEMLFSNMYICIMFSMGVIGSACITLIYKYILRVCKEKFVIKIEAIDYAVLFSCVCFLISLLGVGIVWINSAISTHTKGANLSRGHFYLRYYANAWGPLFLYQIILWKEKTCEKLKIDKFLVGLFVFINSFCMLTLFIPAIQRLQFNSDWFYYVAPFSFSFVKWPEAGQNFTYYKIAGLVITILLILIIWIKRLNATNFLLLFYFLVLMYEYIYGVVCFDKPYSDSENYYQAANGINQIRKENPIIFEEVENIYYISPVFGSEYIVQFILKEKCVINDYPKSIQENDIIITTALENMDEIYDCGYKYCIADENEIILFNSKEIEKRFIECGYKLFEF